MKYYAEYLSNINFVGVYFEADGVIASRLETSEGASLAVLRFSDGSSHELTLPAKVRKSELDLEPRNKSVRVAALSSLETPQVTQSLPPKCICGTALTGPEVKWKRLPSEHWAELMDLWHCHKPSEPTKAGESLYNLAMNGFHAQVGRAYFSDTYFLVHETDIVEAQHLAGCEVVQKAAEASAESKSMKLWHWELDDGPVGPVVSRILIELIDAHAVYTFEVNKDLFVWVLSSDAVYTSTDARSPVHGCKILYGPAAQLRPHKADAEAVDLPIPVYEKFTQELLGSNAKLPATIKTMGKWCMAVI